MKYTSKWTSADEQQTQEYCILQREGFFEEKWGGGGRIGGLSKKGQRKKWKVCLGLDLSEKSNVFNLHLSALQTPFRQDTSLLVSSNLTPRTKEKLSAALLLVIKH